MVYQNLASYRKKEFKNFVAYCRKHPKKCNIYGESKRMMYHYPEATHTVGNPVLHNNKLARVYKIKKNGVEIQYILNEKEGIFGKLSRPVFISEKKYEREVRPYFIEANL